MKEKGRFPSSFVKLLRLRSGQVRAGKSEGFTLIELVLALAVGSVILTGAVMSIYSVLVTTGRGTSQTVALTDINRAALAIKNDLRMAQTTDFLDGVPKSSANLTWVDYTSSFGGTGSASHSSAYVLSGKELWRNYDGTNSIVGRNVTSISFTQSGKAITVVISSGNATALSGIETITFSAHLRPEALP
ncbi:MAG: prepilin-type N-terminal cleavage/methylation domain-containing protein [Chloroflexi bacterium]|nr:prepilin-type N-terminal cleavage/methylation domain-containing protein [Chloroflexota bacterium]